MKTVKKWLYKSDDVIRRIIAAVTFISLLPLFLGALYFLFFFDFWRIIACSVLLVVAVYVSKSI